MQSALVVTSISAPNPALRSLAAGAQASAMPFYVVGDSKSPADFRLDGCTFLSLAAQRETGFTYARLCPERHYARKNIGYLAAIRHGAAVIIETDDDNLPRPQFFQSRGRHRLVPLAAGTGWLNVYRWFTGENVWPRGFPLEDIQRETLDLDALTATQVDCPIQQGLADANPDVDAIYRLTGRLPIAFRAGIEAALGAGSWCPFNSQNTTWFEEAFPLLYLPAHCSFRMTDIWRSFVAQRIAWENGWSVLFHSPTVDQDRNDHRLLADFADEIPGYLNAARIRECLERASLRAGAGHLLDNLAICYQELVALGVIGAAELSLLEAWSDDIRRSTASPATFAEQLSNLGRNLEPREAPAFEPVPQKQR